MTNDWFNKRRIEMISSITEKMLYTELFGELSAGKLTKVIETLETLNHRENYTTTDGELSDEIAYAIVAETVAVLDEELINEFLEENIWVIDLDEVEADYLGDKLTAISDALKIFAGDQRKNVPKANDDDYFIIVSPLVLCCMQTIAGGYYKQSEVGAFRGPNNTMLVGRLDGMPVYTYLFFPSSENVEMVAGYTNPETGDREVRHFQIKNLTLY